MKDLVTGKVEITSMNHGFAVDNATLPANVTETHVSLFDGSQLRGSRSRTNRRSRCKAIGTCPPGPRDSHYLFARFTEMMRQRKQR